MELLQLDDVSDRLSDERRFQFFFDSGVIGVTKLSDLGGDPDNKGESLFEEQNNISYLGHSGLWVCPLFLGLLSGYCWIVLRLGASS